MPNNTSNLANERILSFLRSTLQMSPAPLHLTCPLCHRLFFSSLKFIDHFQTHYHEHQARLQAPHTLSMPVPQMPPNSRIGGETVAPIPFSSQNPRLAFHGTSYANGNHLTPLVHPSWARYLSSMRGGQPNPMAGPSSGHSTRVQSPWVATNNGINVGNLNGLQQTRRAHSVAEQRVMNEIQSDFTSPYLDQLDHPIPNVVVLDNDDDSLDLALRL